MKFLAQLFILLSFSYLLFSLSSCQPDEPPFINMGMDYYPLEIGKYRIFKVDSVIYDQVDTGTVRITNSIYVKEELTDTLRDNLGNLVYTLERFEKPTLNDSWRLRDVYGVGLMDYELHTMEENLRFIKLKFPVGVHLEAWNGNVYIDENTTVEVAGERIKIFKQWLYEYSEVDEFMQVQNLSFDSTLTVIQANDENRITYRYSKESYAKGVGMIKKEMAILNTQKNQSLDPWEVKAQEGFTMLQEIIEYN